MFASLGFFGATVHPINKRTTDWKLPKCSVQECSEHRRVSVCSAEDKKRFVRIVSFSSASTAREEGESVEAFEPVKARSVLELKSSVIFGVGIA